MSQPTSTTTTTNTPDATPFYGGVKSYDIHTYFDTEEEVKFAFQLRENVLKDFAKEIDEGRIRVYKFWEKPIGPHPFRMWELDFKDPEIFKVIVPYFQLNHGNLSVLIHPRTGNDLIDHTKYALWLGNKVNLYTELL